MVSNSISHRIQSPCGIRLPQDSLLRLASVSSIRLRSSDSNSGICLTKAGEKTDKVTFTAPYWLARINYLIRSVTSSRQRKVRNIWPGALRSIWKFHLFTFTEATSKAKGFCAGACAAATAAIAAMTNTTLLLRCRISCSMHPVWLRTAVAGKEKHITE